MAKHKPKWVKTKDANHDEIVQALEKIGCSVYDASEFGGDFPDIVVGYRGLTMLLEIKTEKGRMRKGQTEWLSNWRGFTCVVRSPLEAIEVVTAHVKDHAIR